MDNKDEKFLPIGTVVLLKGGTKKAMITGFCSIAAEDKSKIYDYTGCVYPEGYLDFNQICLFDHEQIEQIFHYGYVDEEEKEFKQDLKEVAAKYESGDEELKSLIEEDDDDDDIEFDFDEPVDISEVSENIPNIENNITSNNTIDQLEYL